MGFFFLFYDCFLSEIYISPQKLTQSSHPAGKMPSSKLPDTLFSVIFLQFVSLFLLYNHDNFIEFAK